jgi:hypothetical protein
MLQQGSLAAAEKTGTLRTCYKSYADSRQGHYRIRRTQATAGMLATTRMPAAEKPASEDTSATAGRHQHQGVLQLQEHMLQQGRQTYNRDSSNSRDSRQQRW